MKYFMVSILSVLFCLPFMTYGELSMPAKKRIYQGKNQTFKRNPVYPWSLADLNAKYGGNQDYEVPERLIEKVKRHDNMVDRIDRTEEILDGPVLEPFVR